MLFQTVIIFLKKNVKSNGLIKIKYKYKRLLGRPGERWTFQLLYPRKAKRMEKKTSCKTEKHKTWIKVMISSWAEFNIFLKFKSKWFPQYHKLLS
jgi:hypothetical protein